MNATGLVNDKKDLQMFAPLGCGIQTGSGTVVNVAQAGPTDAICIMGLGGVGLSAIMGAKIQGCRMIIGIDKVQSRLDLAKELGATHVIDGSKLDEGKTLGDVVKELADGVGPTITIDTTGAPVLMDAGVEFTRNHGRYIQVGSPPFDYTLKNFSGFTNMVAGKQWIGAIEGGAHPPTYVPQMIKWYREGKFPIDRLMKLMPADDFNQALHEMHTGVSFMANAIWICLLTSGIGNHQAHPYVVIRRLSPRKEHMERFREVFHVEQQCNCLNCGLLLCCSNRLACSVEFVPLFCHWSKCM